MAGTGRLDKVTGAPYYGSMRRLYLAGPMTGLPEYNYPAFRAAAKAWRAAGWDVIDPTEGFDGRTDLPYRTYVERHVRRLRTADAIALLDGWDGPTSRGAVWERAIATCLFGLPCYDASTPVTP